MGAGETKQKQESSYCLKEDAENYIANFLKEEMTFNLGQVSNQLKDVISSNLLRGINYPVWKDYKDEDFELSEKIKEFVWITPEMLDAKFPINDSTEDYLANAVYDLAVMTCTDDPFDKLASILSCCRNAIFVTGQSAGADDLIPTLIYIVLKSNPPQFYSNMMFLSNFKEVNFAISSNPDSSRMMPSFFNGVLDNCFTNIMTAMMVVKYMKADEESKNITYGKEISFTEPIVDQLNEEFLEELNNNFKELGDSLKDMIHARQAIVDKHEDAMLIIADRLDEHTKNTHIAKVVGSGTAVAGGIIGIVGFILMFLTFGVSVVLIPVGVALGTAGSLTAGISGFVEYGINKSKAKEIQQMREEYEIAVTELFKSLQKIETTVNSVWDKLGSAVNSSKTMLVLVDAVMKLAKLSVAFERASSIGFSASRVVGAAGSGLAIAGIVFTVILLPIDMVFFGISIKKLKDKEKAKQAMEIRAWLNQVLPSDEKIDDLIGKLRDALTKFVEEIRSKKSSKNNKAITLKKEEFKKAVDDILNLLMFDATQTMTKPKSIADDATQTMTKPKSIADDDHTKVELMTTSGLIN